MVIGHLPVGVYFVLGLPHAPTARPTRYPGDPLVAEGNGRIASYSIEYLLQAQIFPLNLYSIRPHLDSGLQTSMLDPLFRNPDIPFAVAKRNCETREM